MKKPIVKLSGEDGNVFNIIGKVNRTLIKAGLIDESKQFRDKISGCKDYDEVIQLVMKFCDVE